MKRFSLFTFIVTAILLTTSVFAAPSMNKYSSSVDKSYGITSLTHPLTAITIVNATNDYIYAAVPNTDVYQRISSGYNGHITHPDPIQLTNVVIKNAYHGDVFGFNLCRLAIVTIYGYYGHYGYNIDDHLCH